MGVLLMGSILRIHGLAPLSTMLNFDEAFVGVDALSLMETPRLQAYFPNNTGREGLWFYALAPSIAAFGATPFALRIVAIFTGILSVAAMVPLGREVFGKTGGLYAAGGLAVLYWHVHLSHIPFRAILFVLLTILALTAFLRAKRTNRGWVVAGILLGATFYTYAAARIMLPYIGVWILWCLWQAPKQRRGLLTMSCITGIVCLPLALVLLQASENSAHLNSLFVPDVAYLIDNIRHWLEAWFIAGDPIHMHNLSGRPALDAPLLILALAGLVGSWTLVRQRWLLIFGSGLVLAGIAPSVLSLYTPHFLRGIGAVIPLALLIGAGGLWIAQRRYGEWLVIALLAWAGINTYLDFSQWLKDPQLALLAEDRILEGMQFIQTETDSDLPIVMPGFIYDPVADYLNAAQPQRDLLFYEWPDVDNSCYLTPHAKHIVLDLPIVLSHFEHRAIPFSQSIEIIMRHPEQDYNVYHVLPNNDLISAWSEAALFGDTITMQMVEPKPNNIQRGETISIALGMRIAQPPTQELRFFVHLQGDPTPYEGGTLWATGDAPLCHIAYWDKRSIEETIVQTLTLSIPDDLTTGDYHLAIGLYDPDTNERPAITAANGETRFYRAFNFTLRNP